MKPCCTPVLLVSFRWGEDPPGVYERHTNCLTNPEQLDEIEFLPWYRDGLRIPRWKAN